MSSFQGNVSPDKRSNNSSEKNLGVKEYIINDEDMETENRNESIVCKIEKSQNSIQ